jgi:acetylornithine deacetylase/succinyl-diaminopimelate desuccinylase-like protein
MILIDRRTLPGESNAEVIREIKKLLRKNGLSAIVSPTQAGRCGPMETDAEQPLIRQLFRSFGQKVPVGVDYFSDAGILAESGIPSVVFGPGDIAQAHTPGEWISLRQLERGKQMLLRFFQTLS